MFEAYNEKVDAIMPGSLVYEPYYPQNPGIVRKILSDTQKDDFRVLFVEVEWRKETNRREKITVCNAGLLQNFEDLIEDHRRKYEAQSAIAKELRNMGENNV